MPSARRIRIKEAGSLAGAPKCRGLFVMQRHSMLSPMRFAFTKYHALGNDYIVINPKDLPSSLSAEQVRTICHRNYGVGSERIQIGPLLETHLRFPNRTNVQLMKVVDRNNIQIEIWERGAGYTLASGSSSSASAAVAHRLGLCDRSITVHMPGGQIAIEIGDDFAIEMTGPVTKVAESLMKKEKFGAVAWGLTPKPVRGYAIWE